MSRLELSRALGVSKTTVSNWELGLNEPSGERFRQLANLCASEEKTYFLRKSGLLEREVEAIAGTAAPVAPGSDGVEIKVYKSAGAGSFRSVDEQPDHSVVFPRAWLSSTQKLVALIVEGDSMSPIIEKGYIVIVDRTRRTLAAALNHIVAASDGSGVAIRHLMQSGGTYWLQPHNMNYEHPASMVGEETRIIGTIIAWLGKP